MRRNESDENDPRFERYNYASMCEDSDLMTLLKGTSDISAATTMFYEKTCPLFNSDYQIEKDDPFFDEKDDLLFMKDPGSKEELGKAKKPEAMTEGEKQRLVFINFFTKGRRKAELLARLAVHDVDALETFAQYLKAARLVPKLDSIKLYQGLTQLVGLRAHVQEFQSAGRPEDIRTDKSMAVPWLRPLLERLTIQMHIDNLLVENIIMLAHGAHAEANLSQLASCCKVRPKLALSIILASKPEQK